MPKLSDVLENTQAKLDEERLSSLRASFWKHILFGTTLTLIFIIFVIYFYEKDLSRFGGLLVGTAVVIDIYAHWLQLNPLKQNLKKRALILILYSGPIAVIGTLLWTFGDLI